MRPVSAEVFFDLAVNIIKNLRETQLGNIKRAGALIAESFQAGGILHLFGTGHSHMIAEEAYSRAGGVLAINPMLEPSMMLHEGYGKSSALERLPGIAKVFFDHQEFDVRKVDVAVIISNSGRNAAPIEMAMLFREKGVPVIAITSMAHTKHVESRHPSGKKLYQLADIVIDNCGVPGDAALKLEGVPVRACPTSTLTGVTILWSMLAEALSILVSKGEIPPVIMSGNLDEAAEWNVKLKFAVAEKFGERIPSIRTALVKAKGIDSDSSDGSS